MIESLVDYVLQRGRVDYGQFAPRQQNGALFNHRKLLAYLFDQQQREKKDNETIRRISDLKIEQISGQLNYFSQKIHAELSKKHLLLDGDLYRVENEWLRKKIPDFYCYYFLKFAYANTYTRMHELFLSQIENMNRQRDSYIVIRKTIEARQSCLANLRKQVTTIRELQIEQSLITLTEERQSKRKLKVTKAHGGQIQGKSWKNEVQLIFEGISHLRKLTCYVVELIRIWKQSIYGMSEDPRRYRQRVIFFHHEANYLLKMLFDGHFVRDSFLKKYLTFSKHFDPFFLKPAMLLENKKQRSIHQEIFLQLIRPPQIDMDKITKALVILAEEEYDEDQQSRFIHERKNYGQLQQRKQLIQAKRDTLGLKSVGKQIKQSEMQNSVIKDTLGFTKKTTISLKKNQSAKQLQKPLTSKDKRQVRLDFADNKKSGQTERQLEQIRSQKQEIQKKSRIETSLNRVKKIRSIDLKKVSPYLSRNERIQKAQKVIQLQHKFRVAQSQYVQNLKQKKEREMKQKIQGSIQVNRESINSKIFNRYIEQNLKLIDENNRKSYLYKNKLSPTKDQSTHNFNRINHPERKQAEYERNLQKFYGKEDRNVKGTKAIIQISNRGVKANQKIIEFELNGKKGKNVGQILGRRERQYQKQITKSRMSNVKDKEQNKQKANNEVNLFESQKHPQVLIIRQQPQKLQQIKQFLYNKIRQQLIAEMKNNAIRQEEDLNNMIEEEKRKRLQQIIEERQRQEQRRREEAERQRLAKLQNQRKKLSFDVRVEPIQYAQENLNEYLTKITDVQPTTYNRLFTTQKIKNKCDKIAEEYYLIILKGYLEGQCIADCLIHFDWKFDNHRRFVVDYVSIDKGYVFLSSLHRIFEYLWKNDPLEQIEMVVYQNGQNEEGKKIIDDLRWYTEQTGQIFEKQLYSNISELRLVWARPTHHRQIEFDYSHYYFGKSLCFKAELLSASMSLSQRHAPVIDMTLETNTNYIFLLEELFRCYLTPQEVVQLRQSSINIRRLKDIFRIVLELQKNNPVVSQLTVIEGLNLDDLYQKLKDKKQGPYERYYWHNFYDRVNANRILLSILQMKANLKYGIQSCRLDDRRYLRINCREKILVLRSSVYAEENIYVLNTEDPKIKMFVMDGQHFKLMRIQLFVFLNLVFNNIVEQSEKFVNCLWLSQFAVTGQNSKLVKRITDFSISMKKSFFLSEDIFFCNHQFIKNGVSLLPKQSDLIWRESYIIGFLHSQVQQCSTGMPIYSKLIDKNEMF